MTPHQMLLENARRLEAMRSDGDQITGRGVWRHTEEVAIQGYPIPLQHLTPECAAHPLYQMAAAAGSVQAMQDQLPSYSQRDIMAALIYVRCQHDPWYAFATCFRIKHKLTGQNVPFILNHAQHHLLRTLEQDRLDGKPIRLILLKARQWGGSTLIQLYMAWVQLFLQRGWNSVILAQTKDTARRIKAMYHTVLDSFPADLLGAEQLTFAPKEGSTADSIIADDRGNDLRDCAISIASFENFESVRGAAFSMAHYSEVAYWTDTPSKTATQVITNIDGGIALYPLTMQVMESTANGMSGYFYDEYQSAKAGQSAYRALFIPFFLIENDMLPFDSPEEERQFAQSLIQGQGETTTGNDKREPGQYLWQLWEKGATLQHIHWYTEKRKAYRSHDQIASEAPGDDRECFRYSGANVFPADIIEREEQQFAADPLWRGDISQGDTTPLLTPNPLGDLYIWKHPDPLTTTNQYIVTVDVGGRSPKADYSVITVLNRLPLNYPSGRLEVIARWRGHLRYDLMAWKAVHIARHYKNALLVFESNTFDLKYAYAQDFAAGTGDHIQSILSEISGAYRNLYYRRATDQEDIRAGILKKIGFQTNAKTKQEMVDTFTVLFEDQRFLEPDRRFYREADIYQQFPDGHYGNIPGPHNHDDILMTDMIGALISRDLPPAAVTRPQPARRPSRATINESYL